MPLLNRNKISSKFPVSFLKLKLTLNVIQKSPVRTRSNSAEIRRKLLEKSKKEHKRKKKEKKEERNIEVEWGA